MTKELDDRDYLFLGCGAKMGWYRELGVSGRRTFWACFGGWALDAFDAQVYTLAVPALLALWHITNAQAGLLATSALVISSFGGWAAGMLADRIGRAKLLMIMIGWFAFFGFLSGFANNFTQLLVVRGLQGFGFGGEWAAGSVLMGEASGAAHRGKAVGMVQSAWAWGWGAAVIVATVVFQVFPQHVAWRAMFFVGVLPALLIFYVRTYVPEPELFKRMTVGARETRRRALEIFAPDLLTTTMLGAILATGVQGGYYAITIFLPTFLLTERHLTIMGTSGYLAVIIIGSWLGYIVSAYLCDAVGRRKNFLIYSVGSMVIAVAYTQVHISDSTMLVLGFPLGFFASGSFSGMGPILTELFPTSVRGAGQGFCYNFGRGIGAVFPTLVGMLSASVALGTAIGVFAAVAYAITMVAALILPETRGRELVVN